MPTPHPSAILLVQLAALCGCASNSDKRNTTQEPGCRVPQLLCPAPGDAGAPYCTNTQLDPNNCGSCGTVCKTTAICSAGQCTALQCQAGETMCDADATDGSTPYCASLLSDKLNCGCCHNACAADQVCGSGRCEPTADYTFFVFGDMHAGPANFNATLQIAMNQMLQIDFGAVAALSNGDLVDVVSDEQWTEHDGFISAAGFQRDSTCTLSFGAQPRYFGSVGDHDDGLGNWFDLWTQHLPGQNNLGQTGSDGIYFSATFANALFVMLDSEHPSEAQTSWLKTTLEGPDSQSAQLKFLFFHEPVYSCSGRHAPLAAALPWVDLAEQHGVNVIFGSHTHLYTRSCAKRGGHCTTDGTGIIYVETGALGGSPRDIDVTTATVSGQDAAGNPRSDTYDCVVGQDLVAAHGLENDFCHVRVSGCTAKVDCYVVADGNATPFDSWSVDGCACSSDADAGNACTTPADAG